MFSLDVGKDFMRLHLPPVVNAKAAGCDNISRTNNVEWALVVYGCDRTRAANTYSIQRVVYIPLLVLDEVAVPSELYLKTNLTVIPNSYNQFNHVSGTTFVLNKKLY